MIDISKAEAIPGWMTPTELRWLAEQAGTHNAIVEIGSYLGRSTRALGDHAAGFVLAVDDWKGPRDIECDKKNLQRRFYSNLKDLIQAEKVHYLKSDHGKVEIDFPPDMVFIDGDHNYENVKRDILMWKERLANGGLLCGHDFNEFASVKQAVMELLPAWSVVPRTDIWVMGDL